MIPAEAVEAAKAGIRAHAHIDWQAEHLVEGLARAALEAAAPHMLAAAFDEAADAFGEAASWSDGRPSADQVQRWLKSRAAAERTTK